MNFFLEDQFVSQITVALFMPKERGTPIHKDRPTHGFAFNVDCGVTYCFETGETLHCRSGNLIYLPKGSSYTVTRHKEKDSEKRGVYAINFLTALEQNESRPCMVKIRGTEVITSLFAKAANAWAKKGIGYREECLSDLYQIMKLIKMEGAHSAPVRKSLSLLAKGIAYIEEHVTSETISVPHLAQLCKISEPYLRRLFHQSFSVSPAVYIRNLRIRYAKELLSTREYTVSEVALLSGFNDISYFSREFKKATGLSAKEYEITV